MLALRNGAENGAVSGALRGGRRVLARGALAYVVAQLDRAGGPANVAALRAAGLECAPLEGNVTTATASAAFSAPVERAEAEGALGAGFWRGMERAAADRGRPSDAPFPVSLLCSRGGDERDVTYDLKAGGNGTAKSVARERIRAALHGAEDMHERAARAAAAATAMEHARRAKAGVAQDLTVVQRREGGHDLPVESRMKTAALEDKRRLEEARRAEEKAAAEAFDNQVEAEKLDEAGAANDGHGFRGVAASAGIDNDEKADNGGKLMVADNFIEGGAEEDGGDDRRVVAAGYVYDARFLAGSLREGRREHAAHAFDGRPRGGMLAAHETGAMPSAHDRDAMRRAPALMQPAPAMMLSAHGMVTRSVPGVMHPAASVMRPAEGMVGPSVRMSQRPERAAESAAESADEAEAKAAPAANAGARLGGGGL